MIHSISLRNFKSFKTLDKLELKPLTILVGKNSCGKSSIVQSLLLLKQSAYFQQSDDNLIINGEYLQYSEFKELVYNMPPINQASITFSLDIFNKGNTQKNTVEYTFAYKQHSSDPADKKIIISNLKLTDGVTRETFEFKYNTKSYELECPQSYVKLLPKLGENEVLSGKYYALFSGLYPYAVSYWSSSKKESNEKNQLSYCYVPGAETQKPIKTLVQAQDDFKDITYLGPLRATPKRFYTYLTMPEYDLSSDGSNAAFVFWCEKNTSVRLFNGTYNLEEAVNMYLNMLGVVPIGEVKSIKKVIYSVLFDIGGTNKKVPISDVGFGISQLLPIILRALLSKKNALTIFEQPEIHLHPNCQSRLADLFVDMINNDKQVLVETHSVELINKIRLLVLRNPELVDKINVYFIDQIVDNGTRCSVAKKLTLDENGSFDDYPEGFCDESINIMQMLMEEKYKRMKEKEVK